MDCFRTLFPSKDSWLAAVDAEVVLAVVVTGVIYEVGVAVTDPVPVPIREVFKFTLLSVCAVTDEAPLLGEGECSTGELEVLDMGVVKVGPRVESASVFISNV